MRDGEQHTQTKPKPYCECIIRLTNTEGSSLDYCVGTTLHATDEFATGSRLRVNRACRHELRLETARCAGFHCFQAGYFHCSGIANVIGRIYFPDYGL